MQPRIREAIYLIMIALLIALTGQFYYTYHYKPLADRSVKIYYNQDIQANVEVVRTIQDADQFVYFAIYTFTREDIRDALLGAKHRGLTVAGIIDRRQTLSLDSQRSVKSELEKAGIPIVMNDHSYIMHLKTVVTDKGYVSGSYNWTDAATVDNDEILEVGRDGATRKQYEKTLREIIEKYQQRQENAKISE